MLIRSIFFILFFSLSFFPKFAFCQCLKIKTNGSVSKIVVVQLNKKQLCPKNSIAVSTILSGVTAGGVLAGTYPDPALADEVVTTNNIGPIPGVRVRRTTTLSVGNATTLGNSSFNQEVLFNTVVYDEGGNYSTENQRVIVPVGGTYAVTGHVSWTASNLGSRLLILQPGAVVLGSTLFNTLAGYSSSVPNFQTFSHIVKLEAGDTLKLFVAQNSGASLSLTTSSVGFAEMSAQWLAP